MAEKKDIEFDPTKHKSSKSGGFVPIEALRKKEAYEMASKLISSQGKAPKSWKEAKKILEKSESKNGGKVNDLSQIGNLVSAEELAVPLKKIPVIRAEEKSESIIEPEPAPEQAVGPEAEIKLEPVSKAEPIEPEKVKPTEEIGKETELKQAEEDLREKKRLLSIMRENEIKRKELRKKEALLKEDLKKTSDEAERNKLKEQLNSIDQEGRNLFFDWDDIRIKVRDLSKKINSIETKYNTPIRLGTEKRDINRKASKAAEKISSAAETENLSKISNAIEKSKEEPEVVKPPETIAGPEAIPAAAPKVDGITAPPSPSSEKSEEAEKMIKKIEKQRLEEAVEEKIKGKISAEAEKRMERAKSKNKVVNRVQRSLASFTVGITLGLKLKTQNLFNIGEIKKVREEIKEQIEKQEDEVLEKQKEYIRDLFQDIVSDPDYKDLKIKERDTLKQILENRGLATKFFENPNLRKYLDHPIIGNLTVGVLLAGSSALVTKSLFRVGVKTAFAAWGFGVTGGIAGGFMNGFKEYKRVQTEEYNAKKWAEELGGYDLKTEEGKINLAAHLKILEQKITETKYIKGNESSALALMYAMREKKLDLMRSERNEGAAAIGKKAFDQLTEEIENRNKVDDETPLLTGRGKEIFDRLMAEKKEKIWEGAYKGAVKGAIIGGIAGLIVGHFQHAHEVVSSGGKASETAAAASPKLHETAAALACQNKESMHQFLDTRNFVETANSGDGTIELARKAMHDYLINQNGIDAKMQGLTKGQFMLASEKLSRIVNQGNHYWISRPGEAFTFKGEDIDRIISQVKGMRPDQLRYFETHVSDKTWNIYDIAKNHQIIGGENNNFAHELLSAKSNAQWQTILDHNNPEIHGDLMEPIHHFHQVVGHGAGAGAVHGPEPFAPQPVGAEHLTTEPFSPAVINVEHIYTPQEVAANNGLNIDQQHAFELSNIHDVRIPEGAIRNMRQLMLNLENRHESGIIARDPVLYEFAQKAGISDLPAGALKHAASQADINAIVEKVSQAAKPYLTEDFIKTWRAKWIR